MSKKNVANLHHKITTHSVTQEVETRQIGTSKQDHAAHGSYTTGNTTTYWSACWDGHGNDQAIKVIRNADLSTIMVSEKPWELLQSLIEKDTFALPNIKLRSGATMVYTKVSIFSHFTQVEITNIGDSTCAMYVNDEPFFMTTAQDVSNANEMIRVIREKRVDSDLPILTSGSNFNIVSGTKIQSIRGRYINFIRYWIGKYIYINII